MFIGLRWYHWLAMAALLDVAVAVSYAMAMSGEPASVRLWHSLLTSACS